MRPIPLGIGSNPMTAAEFAGPRTAGRSGLSMGRLGVSGGYGAPAAAFEMAFERGCNYFYHGSLERQGMTQAVRHLCAAGRRADMVLVAQYYVRSAWLLRRRVEGFLRKVGVVYADVLLLGWYNRPPGPAILDAVRDLHRRGLVRHVALSGHRRALFPEIAADPTWELFHVRYNAAHRGAEGEVLAKLAPDRPGVVAYTATSWGRLLSASRMPAGVPVPRASDCYRFVLSNPGIDVCMTGPASLEHMKEALSALDRGPMDEAELAWMRRVGDHVHGSAGFLRRLMS